MNFWSNRKVSALSLGLVAGAALMGPAALVSHAGAALGPRMSPTAPSNLHGSVAANGRVTLTWLDNSENETGFRISREVNHGGAWFYSGGVTVASNITTFSESPAPGNVRYKVRAYNMRGNSSYTPPVMLSVSAAGQPPAPPPPPMPAPNAPLNPRVVDLGDGAVQFSWDDNSNNETGFVIERSPAPAGGNFNVGANVTSLRDTPGVGTFSYRVQAVNASGWSLLTDSVTITIAPSPPPPPPPPPPVDGFAVLPPGGGFAGPTMEPPAVGAVDAPGYSAKAIARWDVVPFQTFTSDLRIGVVAFHMAGIDHVDFSANGGAWTPVTSMQLNPETNVWEYTATLRAADFPDGRVEVRAVAYPRVGVPRIVQWWTNAGYGGTAAPMAPSTSLMLFANSHGTLHEGVRYVSPTGSDTSGDGSQANPYRNIVLAIRSVSDEFGSADGAKIYLLPGDHAYGTRIYPTPSTTERWVTIQPAPGVSRDSVRLTSVPDPDGLSEVKLVHLQNLTVQSIQVSKTTNSQGHLWFERCNIVGPNTPTVCMSPHEPYQRGDWQGVFMTESQLNRWDVAGQGAQLIRNVTARDLFSQGFRDSAMIINTVIDGMNPLDSGAHADVYMMFTNNRDNIIIYNHRAYNVTNAQGFFFSGMQLTNAAFVNVLIEKTGAQSINSSWENTNANHVLMWNMSLVNQAFNWQTPAAGLRNISIADCVFQKMQGYAGTYPSDSSFHNNHYVDSTSWTALRLGVGSTTGNPMFANPAAKDYRPSPGSPLRDRESSPLVPIDAMNTPAVGSVGSLQPAQ